jgi:hypothetical protein
LQLSQALRELPALNHLGRPTFGLQGSATQLIVDDKPFLILGGELGNSTSSNLEYMRRFAQARIVESKYEF